MFKASQYHKAMRVSHSLSVGPKRQQIIPRVLLSLRDVTVPCEAMTWRKTTDLTGNSCRWEFSMGQNVLFCCSQPPGSLGLRAQMLEVKKC